MNDTKIDSTYVQALESLKELNNDLFYNDLTNTLKEHSELLGGSYKETTTSLENLARSIHRLPSTFEEQVKSVTGEFIDNTDELLDNLSKKLNNTVGQHEKSLKSIFSDFSALKQEFLQLLNEFKMQQEEHVEKLVKELKIEKDVRNTFRAEFNRDIELWEERHTNFLNDSLVALNKKINSFQSKGEEKLGVLNLNQEKKTEMILNAFREKMNDIQNIQQEIAVSLDQSAAAINLSQQKQVEDKFIELKNICENMQTENDKKNKVSIRLLIGLAVANTVLISGQVLSYLMN